MEDATATPLRELEGLSVAIALPQSPKAPRLARLAVRSALVRWRIDDDELRYAALLIVSELVTNALRHGGGELMHLEVRLEPTRLTIAVRDTAAALPAARSAEDDEETGRGLAIVEGVSDEWGVEQLGARGKRVWAQLSTTLQR